MSLPVIDPQQAAYVERIVQEVIRRLALLSGANAGQPSQPPTHPEKTTVNPFAAAAAARASTQEKLITAASLDQLPVGTRELVIPARAVVTPLAKDEARDRQIQIIRQGASPAATHGNKPVGATR